MISRDQALALIREHVGNNNIIKHMVALEAVMGGVYDALVGKGITNLGGSKVEWQIAGLLHDGDYCDTVLREQQGIMITEWARVRGYEIPDNVAHAMAAHNWDNTGVEPQNLMDWAIFCADSLTGLIVASALVLPDKKLSALTAESVLKRFKSPSFAAGTRRQDIALCKEKLGLELEEFVNISLAAMRNIHDEIGL